MKKIISIPFLLLTMLFGQLQAQETGVVVDQVAAVVGGNIIKLSEIEAGYNQVRMRQGYENAFENRCSIFEQMLLTKLLVHKGQVDSTEVTDEEVEQQVQYYLKNYIRQYGSKESMKQATGYAYDELHDMFFDMLHDRILSQRVENKITEHVKVTPAEVAEFYNTIPKDTLAKNIVEEQYEISEITIEPEVSEVERDRVRTELAKLRERVLNGEKFSMLATLYSQDPGSATKGGELGFFTRGDMVADFEAAAFALKPGEVSPIVETPYGFHIIQLIERRGNSVNARHILLTPKVSAEDLLRARMQLDSIANQIRLGNITFEEAAHKYSDAPSKTLGGKVSNPYTGNNRFQKSLCTELYPGVSLSGMNAGSISNAIQMKNEDNKDIYRLLRLDRKIESHVANLTDDYDNIYNAALNDAKQKKIREWAGRMIPNTFIRIADEFKDCNFELNWLNK